MSNRRTTLDVSVLAQGEEPLAPELVNACGREPTQMCRLFFRLTGGNEAATEAIDLLIGAPVRVALIVTIAFVVNRLVRRGIRNFVRGMQNQETRDKLWALRRRAKLDVLSTDRIPSQRQAQRGEAIGAVFRSTATFVIWTIAAFMVLDVFGVPIGPLIASAGIVGVALGFGAQGLVRDFLSGIFMLVEDQFGVGDAINAGEASGIVEGISLRSTRIRDVQGTLWHIPNGEIHRIGNMSQEWSRALLDIEVAYSTDLDHAAAVIKRVADDFAEDEDWREVVLAEPEIWGVESLGSDGIALRLVIKTKPLQQWTAMREIRRRVKAAFDEEGIEIPFPQRTLWLRTDLTGSERLPAVAVGKPKELVDALPAKPKPAPRRKQADREAARAEPQEVPDTDDPDEAQKVTPEVQ